ncbi:hypothetical protein BKK81_29550 [Cupriavidus sp. USMAHM13]|uniref:tetratricopeptide repeat protein n=1 Tax=Cupriavidus sp. USMAHM13 TaxID=1389192 RepID=UPI0008A69B36|nr:tetratricopeptide repeat protein [Cupriavidus sp. USMAHM13]AOZ03245.1 hypothetical protein BKK81_29550 [Cupriavidus sp. USMAHM13]
MNLAARLDAAQRFFDSGRLDAAAQQLEAVLQSDPGHGDALEGLAYIALRQGQPAEAAAYFERALAVLPPDAERLGAAGMAHQAAGNHARAVALLDQAGAQGPRQAGALHAAAMSLSALGDHAGALERLRQVAAWQPGSWEVHYNMGRALGLLERYEEEAEAYRRAIERKPDSADAHANLGVALAELHRFDEALRLFKKALQLDPNNAGARANRASTNLLLGQFEHGWREYEWRWRSGAQPHHGLSGEPWLGDKPLAGKTLLLHSEQGFGDTLQFVRYVERLAGSGATLVLRVQDALCTLLEGYAGVAAVIGRSEPLPPYDYHCPLMSLPLALWKAAPQIPDRVPYLQADPARRAEWTSWLGPRARPRVGIAWAGSATNLNDRNRSMRLQDWAPLLAAPADFIALQKDPRPGDLAAWQELPALRDAAPGLHAFRDTAALVAELDLVICVDTAVAHLAGALGKPAWILLPFTPDWRWQLARGDSPWYPGTRLFRQPRRGDWASVMAQVQAALRERLAES